MFELDDLLIDVATVNCFDLIEEFTPNTKIPMTIERNVMFPYGLTYEELNEFLAQGYSPAINISECDLWGHTCKPINKTIL